MGDEGSPNARSIVAQSDLLPPCATVPTQVAASGDVEPWGLQVVSQLSPNRPMYQQIPPISAPSQAVAFGVGGALDALVRGSVPPLDGEDEDDVPPDVVGLPARAVLSSCPVSRLSSYIMQLISVAHRVSDRRCCCLVGGIEEIIAERQFRE
jgi:hypothetical protein